MIFSKRMELGKRLDEWCEEHNVCKEGMGYISALDALGYTTEKRALSDSGQSSGSPDLTKIANRIRILALGCKNKDAFSCEFGNEFAPKVEDYLQECFEKANTQTHLCETETTED